MLTVALNHARLTSRTWRIGGFARSMTAIGKEASTTNEFSKLGLADNLTIALQSQDISVPTPVQSTVIPAFLQRKSIAIAAATGSGKTLAYVLPIIQLLHGEEAAGYIRQPQRPRAIVLVPTRDLSRQVLATIKDLSHFAKIAAAGVFGGEQYSLQTRKLEGVVDVVVASPGRLLKHREQGHLFTSHVHTVVIDEVDTMLMQGFGPDVRKLLTACSRRVRDGQSLQIVMVTATMTKAVRTLLEDIRSDGLSALQKIDPNNPSVSPSTPLDVQIMEVDGLHRSLPNVQHVFLHAKGDDKIVMLRDLLKQCMNRKQRVLVFCNTMQSCRAVDYALNENGDLNVVSYHGDLNSRQREDNLDRFRAGEETIMVCTDLAARGLDIPEIDHVILFDFPLNPIDYIHRAGRCGRAGRKGKVTSLVVKRDEVLARAIQGAIDRGLPLDQLSSDRKDYNKVEPSKKRKYLEGVRRPRLRKKKELTPQLTSAIRKTKRKEEQKKAIKERIAAKASTVKVRGVGRVREEEVAREPRPRSSTSSMVSKKTSGKSSSSRETATDRGARGASMRGSNAGRGRTAKGAAKGSSAGRRSRSGGADSKPKRSASRSSSTSKRR